MNTILANLVPALPALVLAALFVWALERNNRRQRVAPWSDDFRHHVDSDADTRRVLHDLDAYDRAA